MSAFKQPYEGINGTEYPADHFLSLEDSAVAIRRVVITLAATLRKTTLVGQPAPVVARVSERMRHPQPGDLVLETSTLCRQGEDFSRGFGILLAEREEWWDSDEKWEEQVAAARAAHEEFLNGPYALPGDGDEPWQPDERMTDHAWYVQYGAGPRDICRWVNCEFMVIPDDPLPESDVREEQGDG